MSSSDFKARAKYALSGNWLTAIIAGFVASLFGASTLNTITLNFNFEFNETPQPEYNGNDVSTAFTVMTDMDAYHRAWLILSTVILGLAFLMVIYSIIAFTVGSAVSVGYCRFNLDLIDGIRPRVGTLFSCFSQMKTAIVVKLLTLLYVTLGYLLFIVPGIILNLGYSMANFVLAENPDMTASEAMRESKRIMKGHKWQLFCLNLSFVGIILLSLLTLGIGLIWALPYANAAYAAFYREVKQEADFVC